MAKNDDYNTTLSPDEFKAFGNKLAEPACPTPGLVETFRRSRKTFGLTDPGKATERDAQDN